MSEKKLITALSIGSAIAFSTLTGGLSAQAMADDGQQVDQVKQVEQQQHALNYVVKEKIKTPTIVKTSNSNTNTYKVQSNDTLSKIAAKFGTTYTNIMKLNNLSSTVIYVGQSLKVSGSASNGTTGTTSSNTIPVSNDLSNTTSSAKLAVATKAALTQMGVPYVFGAATAGVGFDCSGLIYYALKQAGFDYGRTSAAGYYSFGKTVSMPQYGDLVFFKNTYKSGISHVGFYIGGGQMVSASGDKVQISNIHDSYWSGHFAGYKRF
ncbi:MAG: C40 family peptidase [Kurthia sp.]|nr:C40 family peptidase [Candidatus Kurthia equi]